MARIMRSFVAGALVWAAFAGPALAGNWPTFAGSAERQGYNGNETVLTPSTVPNLTLHWSVTLPKAGLTQPLYIEQVATPNGTHDEVFVTGVNGLVAALNATNGNIDWKLVLPTSQTTQGSCIRPGSGVNGTPTIDPVAQLMYVVDGVGALHALSITNGVEAPGYPVQVIDSANVAYGAFNHSSPTMVGTNLYITTSGFPVCEGLRSPYHGAVVEFDTQTQAVVQNFFPVSATSGGGGIWGPGGIMYDSLTGNLFVATGNALVPPAYSPDAESVVALNTQLGVLSVDTPVMDGKHKLLTPTGDLDFGSTPTPIDAPPCGPLLSVMDKDGYLLLYNRSNIAGGPKQALHIAHGGGASPFIGMNAYDPTTQLLFINNPVGDQGGPVTNGAVALQVAMPSCSLTLAWETQFGSDIFNKLTRSTDPMVAGGVVWLVTGAGDSVLALNEANGAPLWSSGSFFTSPTQAPVMVQDGQMFVESGSLLTAWGL